MTWPTDRWPTSSEIADRLRELASNPRYSAICTVTDFAESTDGGMRGNFVRIGTAGASRPSVVIIGGVHAREWAPPTALTNLILALCEAHVANTPVTMGSTSRSAEDVHAIINNIALYIAPMVNPDGYDYSLTNDAGGPLAGRDIRGWRKNRRAAPSPPFPGGCTAANAIGVDINRNFDVLWKFDSFYVVGSNVSSSTNPCDIIYIGSKEFSEPESRNVKALLDAVDPQFFVDVHMSGGTVLYSWGVEENGPIPGATPVLDQGRVRDGTITSGVGFNNYKEPINEDFLTQITALANLMADATGAATNNRYQPQPSANLYPATGTSDDYAFSRNLGTAKPPIKAFTIESGLTFLPLFDTEFAPVQNEIQAAVLALARYAVSPPSNNSCRC